ncbi:MULTISPECIES: hypothetical protein [Thioalkalivibrio]|uniref:DUF5666 domain-containing protein n=1 Tax=Thioalkalivibrio versutus TaxID=106634 RepID=A0A0G3G152_9GAMM|nr:MULTISPECIES: hypothetical protein [Thioalkalivibrio]AKJ94940.1 hypothetical protein TVD_06015 [Thioalkalivibrio versutus]
MTKRMYFGSALMFGVVVALGAVSAQERVQTTDGREILLHADGTYEMVGESPERTRDAANGYRSVSLTDLKLDMNRMGGEQVKLTASVQSIAGMVMLTDPGQPFDANPVMADAERLPRNDRAQILERCSTSGCRVTVQGEVKHLGFGEYGLELHRIVRD